MNNIKAILEDAKKDFSANVKDAESKQVSIKDGKTFHGGKLSDAQKQKFAESAADAVAGRLRGAVIADILGQKEV